MNDLDRTILLLVAIYLAGCVAAFFIGRAYERRRWRDVSARLPHEGRHHGPPPAFRAGLKFRR